MRFRSRGKDERPSSQAALRIELRPFPLDPPAEPDQPSALAELDIRLESWSQPGNG
jgi:hypothetical protein